jgi:hypothetical protein
MNQPQPTHITTTQAHTTEHADTVPMDNTSPSPPEHKCHAILLDAFDLDQRSWHKDYVRVLSHLTSIVGIDPIEINHISRHLRVLWHEQAQRMFPIH